MYVNIDMLICMRTTLNIDDRLMKRVKQRAVENESTITEFVEEALRRALMESPRERSGFKLQWITVKGKPSLGVDFTDRDSLYEKMEERS